MKDMKAVEQELINGLVYGPVSEPNGPDDVLSYSVSEFGAWHVT